MPGGDVNEDDGDKKSREQRLREKLNARYQTDYVQGGAPPMTEEEKFWQMKEQQAAVSFGNKQSKSKEDKKYELLLESQVDFVKSEMMQGTLLSKRKLKRGSESHSSNSSSYDDSEEELLQAEKKLTPLELERIKIKAQRESLPMYEMRDDILAAIRDH